MPYLIILSTSYNVNIGLYYRKPLILLVSSLSKRFSDSIRRNSIYLASASISTSKFSAILRDY